MDSSTSQFGRIHFQLKGCVLYFLALSDSREIYGYNANSVDPGQTPRFMVSDLDLHCLRISLLCIPRVNFRNLSIWRIGILKKKKLMLFECLYSIVCMFMEYA